MILLGTDVLRNERWGTRHSKSSPSLKGFEEDVHSRRQVAGWGEFAGDES